MLPVDYITTKEAAAIIGVSESRVRQLRIAEKIQAVKIDDRTYLYPRSEVERVAAEKPPHEKS